jgi:2-oxoglutarate dehydrogenase E2 component (dihydrolipoamide succinyltransferase)
VERLQLLTVEYTNYQSSTIWNSGMHNIIERPIAVNGKVEIHPMMYVALCLMTTELLMVESVGFLVAVKEALETQWNYYGQQSKKKHLEL